MRSTNVLEEQRQVNSLILKNYLEILFQNHNWTSTEKKQATKKTQHHNNNETKQKQQTKQKINQPKISTTDEVFVWHHKILNSFQFLN